MNGGLRLLLALLVCACAELPPKEEPAPREAAANGTLSDVAHGEIAVVINDNAAGGRHAGMFAGRELSDPSGSYVAQREGTPQWRGPTLADYVAFQLEDGEKVRVYRFRLSAADFAEVTRRIRATGPTPPLFCASAVQNQIAGVGPFTHLPQIFWTSPRALAEELDALIRKPAVAGACLRATGVPC